MTYCPASLAVFRYLEVENMEEERISCPNRGGDVCNWKQKPPAHMGSSSVVSHTYT